MDSLTCTVGIIGIGQLGLPVAKNLLAAGFKVIGYKRHNFDEFVKWGGQPKSTPADIARESDLVILCLPSESAELDALHGQDGLLGEVRKGQIYLQLGTYSKEFKKSCAAEIEQRGGRVLEVEVSGSPPMVYEQTAALYIGGDESLMEECMPVLSGITKFKFHLGEFGSAVAMKLIANQLLTIHTLAAAEAINLGTMAGFDPHRVAEVIKVGAGSSTMFSIRGPMMASRAFLPAPGPFVTLEKYLDLAERMGEELGSATPLFDAAVPYFRRALNTGMGPEDISAVIKLIESDSSDNLKVKTIS